MALSIRLRLWAGLAAGVLAVAAPVAAAGAAQASSTPGPNTPEQVPTGILAWALPGASAFGDTPSSTPEQVSFILRERSISQLESAVTSGLTSFDSVSQGHRVGFLNPSLYAFVAGPDSPVTPLNQVGTGNDNLFYTGNPGELYNASTGLGVPDLATFARDLAAQR
jgi:hypothetical protein